jgi:hypothetical protein
MKVALHYNRKKRKLGMFANLHLALLSWSFPSLSPLPLAGLSLAL